MKIIFSIVIVAACTYIGWNMGKHYKRREKLFEDLFMFCGGLRNQISFFQLKLADVFSKAKNDCGKDFLFLCNTCMSSIECGKGELLSEGSVDSLGLLSSTEKDIIVQFFSSLGKSDSMSQTERIIGFEKIFEKMLAEAKCETKAKGSLYKKLGLFVGLFVVILCM